MRERRLDRRIVILSGIFKSARANFRNKAESGRGSRRRRTAEADLARDSSLFDPAWYLRTYPDVARAGMDPLRHFMQFGWREGRDPGPDFGTTAYLRANPDVAKAGCNPLLHYLEFGSLEGRGSFGARQSTPVETFHFAPAAPCASFPVDDERPLRWRRSYTLDRSRNDAIMVGGSIAGYGDLEIRRTCNEVVDLLECLSDGAKPTSSERLTNPAQSTEAIDAWYVASLHLRTRWWRLDYPFVVRAFQQDPVSSQIELVGEAAICSPTDFIDAVLINRFFPVLFVFAKPAGALLDLRILAFPSLCRGGPHYGESLVPDPDEQATDVFVRSDRCAENLLRIRTGANAAVKIIEVDLDGADGRGPLFQPDFQLWMEKVLCCGAIPVGRAANSVATGYLAECVAIRAGIQRSAHGAILVLPADMLPAIAALTEVQEEPAIATNATLVPFLINGSDPSGPLAVIQPPQDFADAIEDLQPEFAPAWPRLKAIADCPLPAQFPAAALRALASTPLTDAELFAPISNWRESTGTSTRPSITWIVETSGCLDDDLRETMQALALQEISDADEIAFVGAASRKTVAIAKRLFREVHRCASMEQAIHKLASPLAGFVAPGALLHDPQSVLMLYRMLESGKADTISCAFIRAQRVGRTHHAAIVDIGRYILRAGRFGSGGQMENVAQCLWRSIYPVVAPTPEFWIARSARLLDWLDRPVISARSGTHLCSTMISACVVHLSKRARVPSFVPACSPDAATNVQIVVG